MTKRKSRPIVFFAISLFILLQGCAAMKKKPGMHPPMAMIPGAPAPFRIGQIVDVKAGRAVSFSELIASLSEKDLVFLGEVHDNPEHHLIQVQVLQALSALTGPPAVALECFQDPHQEILDRYLGGTMSEEAFLKEVEWVKSWGYDYHFYRPLLMWAGTNRRPVRAINAPAEIVRKVARKGLQGLEEGERNAIAAEIDLSQQAHRAYLRRIYDQHSHGELETFEFFYEAQCVWEETMAENIARFLKKGEAGRMIVIAGNGHLIFKYGIPDRTLRRMAVTTATLLPYPLQRKEDIDQGIADFLWLTPDTPPRFRFSHEMKRTPRAVKSKKGGSN